ncbi:MAG: hypothetical protein GXP44_03000 [bacterium]|nr:hypothetical protein [bacterium]
MKFGGFESDPNKEEKKSVSELLEGGEKDTPRQLKGRYLLTKIVHLLLPKNIPDIYKTEESVDGKQTVDREWISTAPELVRLWETLRSGADEEDKRSTEKLISKEIGAGSRELDLEMSRVGLGFNIDDAPTENYTKKENGDVLYLKTFKSWEVDLLDPSKLEMLFDEEELRDAIEDLSDPETKKECLRLLEEILALAKEEELEMKKTREAEIVESGPYATEIEEILEPFLKEEVLARLNSLTTEEEARSNEERASAMEILTSVMNKLNFLINKTDIADEKYDELYKKYRVLFRAVGMVNRGMVDHDR